MFKVSQEIRFDVSNNRLGADGTRSNPTSANNTNADNGRDCLFGKYQRTPEADVYPANNHNVFIAPELTDPSKVQLIHFPKGAVKINSKINFVIKRNGVKGNFEVKLESPTGIIKKIPLKTLDPERFDINCTLNQAGIYKVHIKCNSVPLPRSPFIIITICGNESDDKTANKFEMPVFDSDASKVVCRGLGLTHISLNEKNEFTVDGSEAGNNILFVGIFGPNGQCDEVIVKHLGKNIYKVCYQVQHAGDYLLAVKWGDDDIPGSPFAISSID